MTLMTRRNMHFPDTLWADAQAAAAKQGHKARTPHPVSGYVRGSVIFRLTGEAALATAIKQLSKGNADGALATLTEAQEAYVAYCATVGL